MKKSSMRVLEYIGIARPSNSHHVSTLVLFLITCLFLAPVAAYCSLYFDEARSPRLVCLMYHRFVTPEQFKVCDAKEKLYSITAQRFDSHLQQLLASGHQFISLNDAMKFIHGEPIKAQNPILITIDDGCESIRTVAEPILTKLHSPATVFVTTEPGSYVFHEGEAAQQRLSDKEICSLDPQVIDLGAHGVTHRPMAEMDDRTLEQELVGPRKFLAGLTHRPVWAMAVPGNWHSPRVEDFAEQAGYKAMFISDPGSIHPGQDPIGLPRLNVSGTMTAERLQSAISPGGMARRRLHWMCNHCTNEPMAASALNAYVDFSLSIRGAIALIALGMLWIMPKFIRKRRAAYVPANSARDTPRMPPQS